MSLFDWVDYTLVALLYGAAFLYGGARWRWIVTVSFLAAHLIFARVAIAFFEQPMPVIAILHAFLAMAMLLHSQTNYGRSIGVCFLAMLALDGLALDGIISPAFHGGIHLDLWNCISTLQHIQAAILATCIYRSRRRAWIATV